MPPKQPDHRINPKWLAVGLAAGLVFDLILGFTGVYLAVGGVFGIVGPAFFRRGPGNRDDGGGDDAC